MTCKHVLDLIDAVPFADCPPAHLDAAWQHARQCGTCGPALDAATKLTAQLGDLPEPAVPADLTAIVLARIARIEQNVPASAAVMAEAKAPSIARGWWAWATPLGGLAAGLAIVLFTPLARAVPIDIVLPRVRGIAAGLSAMPSTAVGALVLAAGLVLYVAGLYAPLADRRPGRMMGRVVRRP